jgi:ATP-dependent DNA helicase
MDAPSASDDLLVTEAMVEEDETLHRESERLEEKVVALHRSKCSHIKGSEDLSLSNEQRVSRLRHLLDKSSLYSDFLFKRMKEQEMERAAKEARAKKKATKSGVSASEQKHPKKGKDGIMLADYASETLQTTMSKRAPDSQTESLNEEPTPALHRQPSLISGGTLREYQLRGVEWLKV